MSNPPNSPSPRSSKKTPDPAPEIDPSPQSVPRKFPENPTPLDGKGGAAHRQGSGEDPMVESGVPDNDPEQPHEADGDKSLE